MKLQWDRFSGTFLLGIFTALIVSGCASFAGKELPIYTNEQVEAPEKKISATYNVTAFGPYGENKKAASKLEKEIQKVLVESPVFAEVKKDTGNAEFHYSFVFRNEGMPPIPLAVLNGVLTGLTFTIIPGYVRDIFILTVEVKQGDRLLKTYMYRDHVDSWIQLFLVVLTPWQWPGTVYKTTVDNMIMNFTHDFAKDLHEGVYLTKQTN